jgi:hypothetical protein
MHARTIDTGALALVPGLERAIARIPETPQGLCLLHGHSSVYTVCLALCSATRQPFAVVDGAMKFNSYTLARIATVLGLAPHAVLRRAKITRSFTAFQTESAITTKLPRFALAAGCRSVLVLGLLDTYYDEQITPHECGQSLRRVVHALRKLAAADLHVLIADVEPGTPPRGKERLFQLLHTMADRRIAVRPRQGGLQLHDERGESLWDATTTPSPSSSTTTSRRGENSGADCA